MRAALITSGPSVSLATMQSWCPTASRRAIDTWVRDDRRRRRAGLSVLRWQRAGRVWAMDISEAPQPIDGVYRYVLHVRDLASGCHLAALPIAQPTADIVCARLQALVRRWGAPLVLKLDHGAAVVSRDLQVWARATGIRLLYSPPRCPRYNGAIEASIGAITTRTHHVAAAAGHPETWSCQDVEHARTWANAVARRPSAPSAHAIWTRRSRIARTERRRFLQACTRALRRRSRHQTARVQHRLAIVDTLRRLKYVSITRRADLVHGSKTKTRQELRA